MKAKNNIIALWVTVLISFLLLGCSGEDNPVDSEETVNFNGAVKVQTDKSEYFVDTASSDNWIIITGTLANTASQDFYSELGDWFDSNFEQELLLFAKWNDGSVEHFNKRNRWEKVEQGTLFEGSRVIQISAKTNYEFHAPVLFDKEKIGQYRLIIKYYKTLNENTTDTLHDVSNTFSILTK